MCQLSSRSLTPSLTKFTVNVTVFDQLSTSKFIFFYQNWHIFPFLTLEPRSKDQSILPPVINKALSQEERRLPIFSTCQKLSCTPHYIILYKKKKTSKKSCQTFLLICRKNYFSWFRVTSKIRETRCLVLYFFVHESR